MGPHANARYLLAMHTRTHSLAESRRPLRFLFASLGLFAAALLMNSHAANAASGIATYATSELPKRSLSELMREGDTQRDRLSDQEYFSFSGVGAIVCSVNGERRNATAFLVGAFDIGVSVAHTFYDDGVWVQPEDCIYTTTDSLGQVRERIPVSYIKAQWASDADSLGQAAADLAVIRLAEPSRFAQRTMPLGKYSGTPASVLMVGFSADLDTGTLKLKSQGRVYERSANAANPSVYTHDMNARGMTAGAPVIDERSGVIIGIHTQRHSRGGKKRNTMITMNEWLESTLRAEMQLESESAAQAR